MGKYLTSIFDNSRYNQTTHCLCNLGSNNGMKKYTYLKGKQFANWIIPGA
jgi:hypothetical protein